ncbi:MAG: class I SAM-dependent DNA methyltransferase [Rhodopirellula sp.]|nr:class I SAM-dependent DNA methyltransferase [Rhodopirellula sp.]
MTPHEFIAKWQRANLSERSAYQQHFLDLCDLLGQPKPAGADPDGAWYTFERGVRKTSGEKGWADVWMRGRFGLEYKGKHRDLAAAYQQLLLYREALENPPLLVVCDLDRIEVHTNFTGTAKRVYAFDLAGLAEPANLEILRNTFTNPDALRPGLTRESITRQAAERFGLLADGMRVRGIEAQKAAHFLMKLMFSMFGEDIGLLPQKLFSRMLVGSKNDPGKLSERLAALFGAMATGGDFGADEILWFNGGLFADSEVIELRPAEIEELIRVNEHDWADVEPSIFGTLFERTLDPAKRSQIGAHYTSREDILTLLEPVVMAPLRREWQEVRGECDKRWEKVKKAPSGAARRGPTKPRRDFERPLRDFLERLAHVRILDPACGSGNFLYVAIILLMDLEKEVIAYGAAHGVGLLPHVRPTQLAGLEINPYAQQLAQVVIWIGYLQWMHHNGFAAPRDPVLEPIESIRLMDAILDLSDPENPKEPEWPEADFIVGNPPFLGGNRIRRELTDDYVDRLFGHYQGRVPAFSDLCCYWFERAREQISHGKANRAGLLATQGIRGGVNRTVLESIKASGDIFFAESDRNWILDGAAVHVSMVGFDGGQEARRTLDGRECKDISANLAPGPDITRAQRLPQCSDLYHEGIKKGASFELPDEGGWQMLCSPNPHGLPNSDVIRTYINGVSLYGGQLPAPIIYYPPGSSLDNAARYEQPFKYVKEHVYPKYGKKRKEWWIHERPRPSLVARLARISRYIATVRHSKHRLFVWLESVILPDSAIGAFAQPEDHFFGILHSRAHETWSRAQGTQVRERESGFRYTPTSCLETFPFPNLTRKHEASIAEAAAELDRLRSNWLNPPEWVREEILEFPGSVDGPWSRYVHKPNARGIGTARYPRLVPCDEDAAKELKKRTLTNLYNQRPTWLELAHRRLDEAVFAAYGWEPGISDEKLLGKLLELNLGRSSAH